jgi:imidazolonepropionase-like amidohydrolase
LVEKNSSQNLNIFIKIVPEIVLKNEPKALVGGTIIDGTGNDPIDDGVLLINNSKIKSIGRKREVEVPKNVKIMNISEKTVIPGLIDAHMHFSGSRPRETRLDRLIMGAPLRAIRAAIDARSMLYMGYTGARDCGSNLGIWLKKAIDEGTIPGPRIMTSGPAINNTFGHVGPNPLPLALSKSFDMHYADGVPECLKAVRKNLREGADFIKIATGLQGESRRFPIGMPSYTFEEIKAMADEAHMAYTIVASHCCAKEGILTSLNAGVDSIEHGQEYDEECAKLMLKKGKILCPTPAINYKPNYSGPKAEAQQFLNKKIYDAIQIAHELGVKIASGSDFSGGDILGGLPMGKNAFDLAQLVKIALSPMDAIVSATKIGAEAMMMEKQIGTLEPGKLADIVIINGNPLDDITMLQDENRIGMVLKGGEIVKTRL